MLWLDGEILENATLDATNAGVLLGHGVFTTLGVQGGAPLFLDWHLKRLRRDAQVCGLEIGFSDEVLENATRQIIEQNGVRNGAARLTVTSRGDGFWNDSQGTSLSIVAKSRAPGKIWGLRALLFWGIAPSLEGVKTTSYWPYSRAFRAALENECDEAILLGHDKFLVEGARASLCWVKDGILFTPGIQTGCLQGVGRAIALDWARKNGVCSAQSEGLFFLESLLRADETFFISGATGPRELANLREPGGAWTPLGGAGEVFGALRKLWETG